MAHFQDEIQYSNIPPLLFTRLSSFPDDTKSALDYFINILTEFLQPIYKSMETTLEEIRQKSISEIMESDMMLGLNFLFQHIKILEGILREEAKNNLHTLKESRTWVLGRIVWILKLIEKLPNRAQPPSKSVFSHCEGDDFVLWIDKALDVLESMRNDFENDNEKDNLKINDSVWRIQYTAYLFNLNQNIKDTVSAAMKICQNCITFDQNIIIARCHVVFRELKKYLAELTTITNIQIDKFTIKVEDVKSKESLHYPTVRLLSDILRDAVYNLEATVNRAVLTLVLECMTDPLQPLMKILEQIKINPDLECKEEKLDPLLDSFDIHMERIIQIGLFSISCSSDIKRILMLRNCMICLEDLETQIIPSLLSYSLSAHCDILIKQWIKEMNSLKMLIFLIIDPVAFIDIIAEKFRLSLIKHKTEGVIGWDDAQCLIALGRCALNYIEIYKQHEPTSLPQHQKIFSNIQDFKTVLNECSVVCRKFFTPIDNDKQLTNSVKHIKNDNERYGRIMKRLKLLYSLVLNISQQILQESVCIEGDDVTNGNVDECIKLRELCPEKGIIGALDNFKINQIKNNDINETKVLCGAINQTFSRSTIMRSHTPCKNNSVFAKRSPLLSSNFYKKHEGSCMCNSASFYSATCTQNDFLLANVSTEEMKSVKDSVLESIGHEQTLSHPSELNFRRNQRKSLRKTLLTNKMLLNTKSSSEFNKDVPKPVIDMSNASEVVASYEIDANTTDWHMTEILEQLTHLSNTLSLMNMDIDKQLHQIQENASDVHVLQLKVEGNPFSSPKKVWNIKVTDSDDKQDQDVDGCIIDNANASEINGAQNNFSINCGIDVSFASNVPTPERMKDINDLEQKLTNLKQFWKP